MFELLLILHRECEDYMHVYMNLIMAMMYRYLMFPIPNRLRSMITAISIQMGRTPIMAAASKGHKEVIKVLLNYGADILLTSYEVSCLLSKFPFTMLIIACIPQFLEMIVYTYVYEHFIFMYIIS